MSERLELCPSETLELLGERFVGFYYCREDGTRLLQAIESNGRIVAIPALLGGEVAIRTRRDERDFSGMGFGWIPGILQSADGDNWESCTYSQSATALMSPTTLERIRKLSRERTR